MVLVADLGSTEPFGGSCPAVLLTFLLLPECGALVRPVRGERADIRHRPAGSARGGNAHRRLVPNEPGSGEEQTGMR